MRYLAMIPARGGSKRIPRKNIKEFLGKPIIAYSIEAALKSGVFDEVMVSTDDEEIAEIARQYGAKVPFMRDEKASDDFVHADDLPKIVLDQYAQIGEKFDYVMMLFATAPFVTPEMIREAAQKIHETGAEITVNVVPFSYPPQRGYLIRNGALVFQFPEYERTRSQDLEKIYHDCGQFYFYNADMVLGNRPRNGIQHPIVVPEEFVQDIDTESDWHLAEIKYKRFILGEE